VSVADAVEDVADRVYRRRSPTAGPCSFGSRASDFKTLGAKICNIHSPAGTERPGRGRPSEPH
jgi:hypothetical protein